MTNRNLVAIWVRRFLLEHVVADRNLSPNTQASYRDALALLLPFAAKESRQAVDLLEVESLSPELVRRFLAHLESERHCSHDTESSWLAAIHAFALRRYAQSRASGVVRRSDRHPLQEGGQGHAALPREARDGRGPRRAGPSNEHRCA
jgi:site-specific recombinase XerD